MFDNGTTHILNCHLREHRTLKKCKQYSISMVLRESLQRLTLKQNKNSEENMERQRAKVCKLLIMIKLQNTFSDHLESLGACLTYNFKTNV